MIDETTSSNQTESIVEPAPISDLANTILPPEPESKTELELPIPPLNSETIPEPLPVFDFRQKTKEAKQRKIEARLGKIVDYVRQNSSITNDQIQKLLRVSDATASRYAKILVTRNLLKKSGKTKSVKYELV